MSRTIKRVLNVLLVPVLRVMWPGIELFRRAGSHLALAARIDFPVDDSVVVMGGLDIRGTGRIKLGRNLLLFPDLCLETNGSGLIEVQDAVVISRGVHIVSHSRVVIGEGTMIGEYSSIRDANHLRLHGLPIRESGYATEPITIGREVWIGCGVTILSGVTIGDGATVGANAVVTCDVEPGMVVAGVPARPLRSRRSEYGPHPPVSTYGD